MAVERLREGAWTGRRAFILGGGPSLMGFDSSLLHGELTLGLNMAFLHNPTANLVYDLRLMEQLDKSPMWRAYRGFKFWLNYQATTLPDLPYPFEATRPLRPCRVDPAYPRWPSRLDEGIYRGNNAGTAGICLADVLRADPIYLLGFDLRADAGRPTNWHQLYPAEWRATDRNMRDYREDIRRVAGFVRGHVVNLTPDSALDVFPTGRLEEVIGVPG